MRILGIETSCDETAAAVVEDGRLMLSNAISSSVDLHAAYGGVVPEIAARSHIESIIPVLNQALEDAFGNMEHGIRHMRKPASSSKFQVHPTDLWSQIDAIAVTNRPGLIGSLMIGVMTARTLAIVKNKPLYGVNHVLAHTYANFLTEKAKSSKLEAYGLSDKPPEFPLLALIISGGHTQLMLYESHQNFTLLGQTKDDAVGEAFDKVAKILGLPYPGGPSVALAAEKGDPSSVNLPIAKLSNPYDFSFSGLKTAVLRCAQQMAGKDFTFPSYELPGSLTSRQKADLSAAFQRTAAETLAKAAAAAEKRYNPRCVVLAGGVAANRVIREELTSSLQVPLLYPDTRLCTDNAAMIAAAAYYQRQPADNPYKLAVIPSL